MTAAEERPAVSRGPVTAWAGVWARTRIALALLSGRVGRCRAYERRSATEVHVRSRGGPLQLVTDGEAWRGADEVIFRKRPAALHVVQPRADDARD